MVSDGTLDMVVTLVWVGALAVVLLAQAFVAWFTHRHVTKSARMAERLARATAPRTPEPPVPAPVPLPSKATMCIVALSLAARMHGLVPAS